MSVTVKPSLRPPADTVRANVEARASRDVPGLTDLLDQHVADLDAGIDPRFSEQAKQQERERLAATLHEKLAPVKAAAIRRETYDRDQEEGALMAALRNPRPDQMASDLRASTMASMILQAPLEQLDALYADAELTGDPIVIRSAGYAMLTRLRSAADADRGKDHSSARDKYLAFKDRVERWQREHPTPAARLAQIQRERENIVAAIGMAIEHALRLYGLPTAGPQPTLRPGAAVGPEAEDRPGVRFVGPSRAAVSRRRVSSAGRDT